ncbi:MAG TPA: hypothetical protein EYO73_10190 [Sulfurimonas sp.]|nr:hypothetical protein [Sulfurimonas sp.]
MEFTSISIEILIFLFLLATLAGLIDTLAGGGGLITIPALLISGVPPLMALGTNKVQAVIGSGTASYLMFKKKKVLFKNVKILMLYAFVGSMIGTIIVQFINVEILNFIIPIVLILFLFLYLKKTNI